MSELVSIIMGVYNAESTLEESIESILKQTYDNWEFIICDDGSTDNTSMILNKYKEMFPTKFKIIKNDENLGLNKTLNRCLEISSGIFIARQDADDKSLPERLQIQTEYLLKHKDVQIVSSGMIHFCDGEQWNDRKKVISYPSEKDVIIGSPICHAPVMMWKKCYDDVNGYSTRKSTLRVEDVDLWIRLYKKGYRCFNIEKPLYAVRDDLNAFKRRKYRYRINSSVTRIRGAYNSKQSFDVYIKAMQPLLIGLIPAKVRYLIKNKVANRFG